MHMTLWQVRECIRVKENCGVISQILACMYTQTMPCKWSSTTEAEIIIEDEK